MTNIREPGYIHYPFRVGTGKTKLYSGPVVLQFSFQVKNLLLY